MRACERMSIDPVAFGGYARHMQSLVLAYHRLRCAEEAEIQDRQNKANEEARDEARKAGRRRR